MDAVESAEKIRNAAMVLDNAVEQGDKETILSCFADDAELEVFGLIFTGKNEIENIINWMYAQFGKIEFEPVVIMVEGNTFFEEFVFCVAPDSDQIKIKAAEVLEYEDHKIKSLRLYIDRLDMAQKLSKGVFERLLVNFVNQGTIKGLPQPGNI